MRYVSCSRACPRISASTRPRNLAYRIFNNTSQLRNFAISMSSKLDYLQKYLSKEERADGKGKKRKKKVKKRSNVAILDDDVDWKELVPKPGEIADDLEPEGDPGKRAHVNASRDHTVHYSEYAPSVADVKDEAEEEDKKSKWKTVFQDDRFSPAPSDFSPPRRPKRQRHDSPDQQSLISSPP